MSDNLMDLVKGAVSKELMGKLGGFLGQSPEKTNSAFEIGAGSILGGIMKKASSKQGASDIFDLVKENDGSVLDKLGDIMGGGDDKIADFQKSGSGVLDSLFGGDESGALGMIAKAIGLDEGMVKKLLSMLAPIIMGVLGKYVKSKALDAVGLGKLMGDQKQHLGSYMPSGLTDQLGLGNLLGNVTGAVGDAAGKAGDAGRAAMGAADDASKAVTGAAGDAAAGAGNLLKIVLPVILLGVLAFLAYQFLMKGDGTDLDVNPSTTKMNAPIDIKGVDFGGFDATGLTDKFTGITDGFKDVNADNAQGLADKISGLTSNLDSMGFDQLPAPAKEALGSSIGNFKSSLEGAVEKVKDESFFASILKPVIDALMEKFQSLGF